MHLYKNFFRVLNNNKSGLLIYGAILFAMAFSLILASRTGGMGGEASFSSSFSISYEDHDGTAFSRGLIEYLSEDNTMTDLSDAGRSKIEDLVFFRMSEMHLVIENGEVEYLTDYGNSGNTFLLTGMIDNYKSTYDNYILMGKTEEESAASATALLSDKTEISVLADEDAAEKRSDMAVFYLNQFYPYLAIGFMSLGVGHTIIENNDALLNSRIESSPVSRRKMSLANTLGLSTAGIVLWLIFMVLNLVLGKDTEIISDHLPLVALNLFLSTMIACAIASLITSFDINSNSLSMVTNIVSLGMSFLSGVFIPQVHLGDKVLRIARFLPLYWSTLANNMTCSRLSHFNYDADKLVMCFVIEFLFAVALAVTAAIVSSARRGKAYS